MNEDSTFYGRGLPPIEHRDREAFIRHENAVSIERFLMIRHALHRSKHVFEVIPHLPTASAHVLGNPMLSRTARRLVTCRS